jgi:hypothetical protein
MGFVEVLDDTDASHQVFFELDISPGR